MENPVSELVFVGFGIERSHSRQCKSSIGDDEKAGIKVVIITGDHRIRGCDRKRNRFECWFGKCLEGKDLERMNDEELKGIVKKITVYARILPHDKLRIVEALKSQGKLSQ